MDTIKYESNKIADLETGTEIYTRVLILRSSLAEI
jgi:hypothetical protein